MQENDNGRNRKRRCDGVEMMYMSEVKDIVFHGVKARKIGTAIFMVHRPGYSLKFIEGSVWFADGEYRRDAVGEKAAEKTARRMRQRGYKARVLKTIHGIQVFCNKKAGASL